MNRDASPEHDPTPEAVVDDFLAQFEAVVLALNHADVSRATPAQMRQIIAVMDEVEGALDGVVAAVEAANTAS